MEDSILKSEQPLYNSTSQNLIELAISRYPLHHNTTSYHVTGLEGQSAYALWGNSGKDHGRAGAPVPWSPPSDSCNQQVDQALPSIGVVVCGDHVFPDRAYLLVAFPPLAGHDKSYGDQTL